MTTDYSDFTDWVIYRIALSVISWLGCADSGLGELFLAQNLHREKIEEGREMREISLGDVFADGIRKGAVDDDFDLDVFAFPLAGAQSVVALAADGVDRVSADAELFQIRDEPAFEFVFGDDREQDEIGGFHEALKR